MWSRLLPATSASGARNVEDGPTSSELVVHASVDNLTDFYQAQRTRAHDAWFARDVQCAFGEACFFHPTAAGGEDAIDGIEFGVARRIPCRVRLVAASGNDASVSHEDAPACFARWSAARLASFVFWVRLLVHLTPPALRLGTVLSSLQPVLLP